MEGTIEEFKRTQISIVTLLIPYYPLKYHSKPLRRRVIHFHIPRCVKMCDGLERKVYTYLRNGCQYCCIMEEVLLKQILKVLNE